MKDLVLRLGTRRAFLTQILTKPSRYVHIRSKKKQMSRAYASQIQVVFGNAGYPWLFTTAKMD